LSTFISDTFLTSSDVRHVICPPHFRLFLESTQTVQALQYSTVDGPITASKDLEIKSLKEEIEKLKKQVTGML